MFINIIKDPWPWYIAGPLIGLMVPILLIIGNKTFGVSSSLRHICAACFPAKLPFFNYDWKKEAWNLFFVAGILFGGVIVAVFLQNPGPVHVDPRLMTELGKFGITEHKGLVPTEIFNWDHFFTPRSLILIIAGGFMVGFGTRYAGGCTSGHSIMGLSNLQLPSLIATICFMIGGFIMSNLILPYILNL